MNTPIFNSEHEEQQHLIFRDGYALLPFLDQDQVEKIKKIYEQSPLDPEEPFYSSSFVDDNELKQRLNDQVLEIAQTALDKYFSEIKVLGCSFLTKQPGEKGKMMIHQDWTVVDESKYGSYTLWIPLQDTTEENGAIQLIAGSHIFTNALRAPSLPIAFKDIYGQIEKYLQLLPMKAGEAFCFNHALMHGSPPNTTGEPRAALAIGIAPKDAELLMYYGCDNNTVEKYSMPDNMFVRYNEVRHEPKIGEKLESFEYEVDQLTPEEFREKIYLYRKEAIKMKPLFLNPEHQQFFEDNGYLKLPILNEAEVAELKEFYAELGMKDEMGYGFQVGMDMKDKGLVKKMMDRICDVAMDKVQEHMVEAQVFSASYVVKEANPKGVVPPHQDWTFVDDERKHCSVTCWIPLQDVDINNGCMGVIKGSNKFFENIRPSPSPQTPSPLGKHMFTIFPFLQLVEMKAGEAMFFDNRTIHASPPNTTDEARLAVGLGFTQAEADIRHFYLKPGTTDTLLKYKIDPEFFKVYDNASLSRMYDEGKLIEGYELLEEVPFNWEDLTAEEFTQRMQDAGNQYNARLVAKMSELFGADGKFKGDKKAEPETQEEVHEQPEPIVQEEAVAEEPALEPEPVAELVTEEVADNNGHERSFWQTYTPLNVLREIKFRITGN